jgi:N-acetylmuramoyl-L-alanine amidase
MIDMRTSFMKRRAYVGAIAFVALPMLLAPAAIPPAWSQRSAAVGAKIDVANCDRPAFRVIVDVGHTARNPGARSARGFYEYDFNLRLAKEIQQGLLESGFARSVLLVTAEWRRVGLFQRTAKANSLPADLFLSIHHDSVPDRFMENWEYEGVAQHFSDRFKGHSLFVSYDNGDVRGSLLFGRLLGLQLKARGLQYTPHYVEKFMGHRRRELVDAEAGVYRYDQLIVLKSAHMPAVLLEAGSIINRDEELLMGNPERRARISAAVTDAVTAFCALRTPRIQPAATVQRATSVHRP